MYNRNKRYLVLFTNKKVIRFFCKATKKQNLNGMGKLQKAVLADREELFEDS